MNSLYNIWKNLTERIDPETLNAWRSAIPQHVHVQVKIQDGLHVIVIDEINHEKLPKETLLISEASSRDGVQHMVNDLVLSYKRVPEIYRPYLEILTLEGTTNKNANTLTLVKG